MRKVVIATIVIAAVLIVANWWSFRPQQTSQNFVRLLTSNQLDDAAGMVKKPGEIVVDADICTIRAEDGTVSVFHIGEMPFFSLDDKNRPSRAGITDYVFCRMQFQLIAVGVDPSHPGEQGIPVYCLARGTEIIIEHVGFRNQK